MNQKQLAINIMLFLEKSNKDLRDLAQALGLSPRYLKSKLHKMTKSKDESFSFEYFLKSLEFFNVTLGEFVI